MEKPCARLATALPIRPPPPIRPMVLPQTEEPSRCRDWPPGNLPGAHQPVAFHHAARHREHQPEGQVGGRLGRHRRHHGDRDAALGRLGDVDVRRRDRLRRDVAQLRIGGDHRAVDLVVQQAEQDVGLLDRVDQRLVRDDAAVVRINLHAAERAQALDRAVGDRLGDEDARLAISAATARRRRRRRPRTARRRESCAWHRARRAPSECRARARARPDARSSRRARRRRRRPAAGYG